MSWAVVAFSNIRGKVPSTKRRSLGDLPPELLVPIIEDLHASSRDDVLNLSLVSRKLRDLCTPVVFRTVHIEYNEASLGMLLELARSPLRNHVKSLRYSAREYVNPALENEENFRKLCSPDERIALESDFREYVSTQAEGERLQYEDILSQVRRLAKSQRHIHEEGLDDVALTIALQSCVNLVSFTLRVRSPPGLPNNFEYMGAKWNEKVVSKRRGVTASYETVLRAIYLSRSAGTSIQRFEVDSPHGPKHVCLRDKNLVSDALANITSLHFTLYSRDHADLFQQITFPRLQRLEFSGYAVNVIALEDMVQRHRQTLRVLHMKNTWFFRNSSHVYLEAGDVATTKCLKLFERIGKIGILHEARLSFISNGVSSSGVPKHLYDASPLEELLMGNLSASDFTPELIEYMGFGENGNPCQ